MAKKKLIDLTDEELAKKEEEQNLAEIEGAIDSVILDNKNRIAALDKQISDYYVVDQDDREGKLYLMESRNSHRNTIDVWESYKDSPYYGRMDLVRNGTENEVFFVGEKGIANGAEIYVIDWRTPIGGAFANKQSTRYKIKGNDYRLILRREVNIKNAKVIDVHTEYDDGSLSLDGEVIDPFLLSVLRDKRRNYKLTDIIRTIQGNQNELIRKPIEESFIVQGCAGSGKTMILLHRLSYIAFNFPNVNFSRFCVLTPNEYFNIHVDELSKKLGLDKIKRYTVEAFYASWIRFLGKNDTYTTDTVKRKILMKVDPVTENVSSEKLLNNEMLEEIYSKEFYNSIILLYEDHWKSVLDQLLTSDLKSVLVKNGKTIRDNISYGFITYSALKKSIADIVSAHSAAIKACDKAKADLEKAEQQILSNKKILESATENLNDAKETLLIDLTESEKKCAVIIEAARRIQAEAIQTINEAKSDKSSKFTELKAAEDSLSIIKNGRENFRRIDYLRSSDSEIARIILERCNNEIKALEEAETRYNKVPFYNFGKRSRAKFDLDKATEALAKSVDSIIDEYAAAYSTALDTLRREIAALDASITEANKKLAASDEDKITERKLVSVRKCKDLFELEEFPDIEKKLKPIELGDLPDSSKVYFLLYRSMRNIEGYLKAATRQRDESAVTIEKSEGSIISAEDVEILKRSMDLVEQLDFASLFAKLDTALKNVYKKHGQKMRTGVSYRHGLLYKLLLCSLYYEHRTDIPYFINVDEAQDLAETEYMLLRRILGPKTTFNLYGDVNQLVYSYKGITQWDDIAEEITPNIYFLNENYRNTLQITDYCNKEFEADVIGIGLSGEDVKKIPFRDAISELLHIKETTPGCRAAIIYRKGLNTIVDALADHESVVAFDQVDAKRISVITVEESKGLEFDAVIAVDSQMTMNEKYISYTRALDNLIISDLPGSEIETEEEDDTPENEAMTNEGNETTPKETEEPAAISLSSNKESSDAKAVLTDEPVNIRVLDAAPYINAFFGSDPSSNTLFKKLIDDVKHITPDIMIRVSNQYIGLAKQNEKCRLYIAFENNKPFIKFKHLFAKEAFMGDRYEHYLKAYQQCCQYIEKYPESIRMKKEG